MINAVIEQEVKVENVREGVRQLSEEAACELTDESSHGFDGNPPAALFFLFSAGGPSSPGQEEWAGLVLRA